MTVVAEITTSTLASGVVTAAALRDRVLGFRETSKQGG